MIRLWSTIATFNILFLLNLCLIDRTDHSLIKVFAISSYRESVPIFGLSLGSVITILNFYLFMHCIESKELPKWYDRFPSLWIDNIKTKTSFGCRWKGFVLFLVIVFPIFVHGQFWLRFNDWQAWKNYSTVKGEIIGLLEPADLKVLIEHGWDAYRYGDYSKRNISGREGFSFIPLFQPLLMLMLSMAIICLFIRIFIKVFKL